MGAGSFDSFEHDWEAAVEIGSEHQRKQVTLTRIATTTKSKERPVFLQEIPAEKGTFAKSVRYRRRVGKEILGSAARWMRLEFRVPSKLLFAEVSSRDLTLVVAAPSACGWVHTAPFRISNKKSDDERDNPLWTPAVDDAEIIERIESQNCDFWENDDYWTAGISDPGEPAFEEVRRNTTTPWRFGIVENYEQVVLGLIESAEVRKLLALTANGTLQHWPTNLRKESAFPEKFKPLHPDTKESADWLIMLAIRQALAGGGDEEARWFGQPVVKLVEEYYKDLVCFYNRKTIRREIRELRIVQAARDYALSEKRMIPRVRKRPSRDS